MAAAKEVRARLGAARIVLERSVGTDNHTTISQTQCLAVISTIKRVTLSVEEQADLQAVVAQVQWAGGDMVAVLAELAGKPSATKVRRSMQEFGSIAHYFTGTEWDVLLDPTANMHTKSHIIVSKLAKLGCRCPTEPSLKTCASILLVV